MIVHFKFGEEFNNETVVRVAREAGESVVIVIVLIHSTSVLAFFGLSDTPLVNECCGI